MHAGFAGVRTRTRERGKRSGRERRQREQELADVADVIAHLRDPGDAPAEPQQA